MKEFVFQAQIKGYKPLEQPDRYVYEDFPWTKFSKTNDPSFGNFSWNNYNDSFELALIGNKVRAIRNPFLERYELIEKYKIF